jgi:hypothetical protein
MPWSFLITEDNEIADASRKKQGWGKFSSVYLHQKAFWLLILHALRIQSCHLEHID